MRVDSSAIFSLAARQLAPAGISAPIQTAGHYKFVRESARPFIYILRTCSIVFLYYSIHCLSGRMFLSALFLFVHGLCVCVCMCVKNYKLLIIDLLIIELLLITEYYYI